MWDQDKIIFLNLWVQSQYNRKQCWKDGGYGSFLKSRIPTEKKTEHLDYKAKQNKNEAGRSNKMANETENRTTPKTSKEEYTWERSEQSRERGWNWQRFTPLQKQGSARCQNLWLKELAKPDKLGEMSS